MLDVTAVVLCYNRLDYTKICLDSFIKTAPIEYGIVIVDNGSTDGTREYLTKQFKKE